MQKMTRRLLPFFLLIIWGCSDDVSPKQFDVYIAGSIEASQAVFWKNGDMTNLTDGTQRSFTTCATAAGKDFYVGGMVEEGGLIAAYWKNGTMVKLTDGSSSAFVYAIAVSGSDVYVGGYETVGGVSGIGQARIWKNGKSLPLQLGSNFTTVLGIAISGADVYAIGIESKVGGAVPKYWKNGVEQPLIPSSLNYSYVLFKEIEVAGNDIHIIGYILDSNNAPAAKYWKNGVEVPVTNISPQFIEVVNSDVYILDEFAKVYIKNGVETRLPPSETRSRFSATGFEVVNDDVYVTAIKLDQNGRRLGSYLWKNGEEQAPMLGNTLNVNFTGLALIER